MRSFVFSLAAVVVGLAAGCGSSSDPKPVTGTLTLGGKPLARVTISLIPEAAGGTPLSGSSDDQGAFALTAASGAAAPPGAYKVVVLDPNAKIGKKSPRADDPYLAEQKGPENPTIPAKYARADTSLTVTVEADKPLVIELPTK